MRRTACDSLFLVLSVVLAGCGSSANSSAQEDPSGSAAGSQEGGTAGSSSGSTGSGGATNTDAGGLVGTGGSTTGGAGTNSGAGGSTSGVKIVVSPHSSTVLAGHSLKLEVDVSGTANKAVTWSVADPNCGTVSDAGEYAAPAAVPDPAVCHVKATSSADAHAFDVAVLGIATSGSTGTPGVWENVTPAGISLATPLGGQENFGAQDVLVDPVRQSDIYAFFCYQGVWKSTNYGVTWAKVSTGTNASVLETGRPWTTAIDNDRSRDPSTPPTLYTTTGYGSAQGFFKSTDGGINWTHHDVVAPGVDPYSLDMDPYDDQHIITGLHEGPDLAESTDGGLTWKRIPANGKSIYPFFVDTGDAATTRKTWLAISQDQGPALKTKNGGASFEPAGDFAHPHGGSQLFNSGSGTAYAAGTGGVWKSTDAGESWGLIQGSSSNNWASNVTGTATTLYSWNTGAILTGIGNPNFMTAPRNAATPWTAMAVPPAMNNGPKKAAVTYDGAHDIILGGAWTAGLWRYVEP